MQQAEHNSTLPEKYRSYRQSTLQLQEGDCYQYSAPQRKPITISLEGGAVRLSCQNPFLTAVGGEEVGMEQAVTYDYCFTQNDRVGDVIELLGGDGLPVEVALQISHLSSGDMSAMKNPNDQFIPIEFISGTLLFAMATS